MEQAETSRLSPHPLHFLWAGLLAIGFLGLVIWLLPNLSLKTSGNTSGVPVGPSAPRQHVLVLVVDSTDQLAAHGAHVDSVIRQYCGACEVRQLNVHGNMSTSRLQLALAKAQDIVGGVAHTTTVIINLSWGTYTYHASLHNAIRELRHLGAIIVASAGNDNTSKPFYPAAFDEVLGICSSSRYRKTKAAYSNFGPWVSLCAPGLHYVSRPLHHGSIASGTSFASPMVSGVLGQSLLDAPCATTSQGLQALLRTADSFPDTTEFREAKRLNGAAASHYLKTLYTCENQPSLGLQILHTLRRISSNTLLVLGLLLYAVVSIFALPILLAFVLERFRLRAERRMNAAIQMAYTESLAYRTQRLHTLKQRFRKTGRIRYREEDELLALLHAQYLYDEPCEWCDGQQLILADEVLPPLQRQIDDEQLSVCSRCGLKPEASTLSLDR